MKWTITLDDDYVNNATQLSIARTLIHESVHAYMGYSLKNYNTSDMVMLLAAYRGEILKNTNNQYDQDELDNLTTHNFMPQFVDAMAYSLAVWDNHRLSIDYYKMLSWGGLESSSAYQALSNKTNIQNAIQNERYNKVGAKSTKCP